MMERLTYAIRTLFNLVTTEEVSQIKSIIIVERINVGEFIDLLLLIFGLKNF